MNIFDKYYAWKVERQKLAARRRYLHGFDWALGAIARGEETPISLEAQCMCYHGDGIAEFPKPVDVSDWNRGVTNAIEFAVKHEFAKDDRF